LRAASGSCSTARIDNRDAKIYFRNISFASEQPRLTSAAALRALGHKTRLRLLGFLRVQGDATATECAAEVGESPQSCSYHLRTLAKHGFVEEVPSDDGRERRWQARVGSVDWDAGTEADEDFQAAAQLARAALLEVGDDAIRDYLAHERSFTPAWREASTFLQTTVMVTPAELAQLGEAIHELLAPYAARSRERKPRGSRIAHFSIRGVPKP
jgi:DNA-binding transcriptional ArsR family regulator